MRSDTLQQHDIWTYTGQDLSQTDITGFGVEATDGSIGSVDEATWDVGRSFLVIDTGPWIFGKKVMIPAGVIERIDPSERKVHVALTKDQIQSAPEFDEMRYHDPAWQDELGIYYSSVYAPPTGVGAGTGFGTGLTDEDRRRNDDLR